VSPARQASIDLSAVAAALADEGASAAALARAAGVAKPTLYAHYGSREGLVRACVDHEAERLLDHVYEADDPGAALAAYAAESAGWPLLLLARHPAAVAARRRVAARIAEGGRPSQAAAAAFLAAAGSLLESGAPVEPAAALLASQTEA
jgi:AcrR family transcriptional regulator